MGFPEAENQNLQIPFNHYWFIANIVNNWRGNPIRQKIKRPLATVITLMFFLCMISMPSHSTDIQPFFDNHPLGGIWDYENLKNQPQETLILSLDQIQWQVTSAACITPAFFGRIKSTPLLFDDGTEEREISIPHIKRDITDFGGDAQQASANIATTYWTRAEIVIVAGTYEQVLLSVPVASFLSAPILVTPSQSILGSLGTKCAIVLDDSDVNVDTIIRLKTKEDIWKFQLELYDMKGQVCNYVIMTNPYDTPSDDNIKWKFHSLASAPLAAFRKALVQPGNYTGDRDKIDSIAKATKTIAGTYDEIKPYFYKVKSDSYNTSQFLLDFDHNPEFLAVVGGTYAVPNYFFDYHVSYFYWDAKVDYVASLAPYANLYNDLEYLDYPHEELGAGRILSHSILDSTLQLTRTFFYDEFLPGGKYVNLAPDSWEQKSAVIEGHRLNQPQSGGPPVPNDIPYVPAGEVDMIFTDAGFNETYFLPRNFTQSEDSNMPIGEVLDTALNSSIVLINAHGGLPGEQALIEIGLDEEIQKEYLFTLDKNEAEKRNLPPSVIYVIACETGTTSVDLPMEKYVSLGFIHSGAVAYIAPDTYQTICFWDKAPDGPEANQSMTFFQNLLSQNIPIGKALAEAKWEAYLQWMNVSSVEDDIAGATVLLYGDPAFEPYKPQVPFKEEKRFDIISDYNGVFNAGSSFDIKIMASDLDNGQTINDAGISIKFQGKTVSGSKGTFESPNKKGSYPVTVTLQKDGYQETTAKFRVHVKNDAFAIMNFILIGSAIIAILAAAVFAIKKRKKGDKNAG
jgi:hypothetical protein